MAQWTTKKLPRGFAWWFARVFSLAYSEPEDGKFVFTYLVLMENQSGEVAQLLYRHWRIHDSEG